MMVPKFAASVVVIMLLAGCQKAAAPEADNGTATVTAPPNPGTPSALWNGGKSKPLDVQVAHPNGSVLQLTSLQSRPTETAVGIRVINGRDRDIDLNRFNSNRDGYLLLDSGERLYLSPPTTNTRLTIPAGQTFEGELVFLGRLPTARAAVLVLNENSSSDNEYTTTPGFRIDLPLAGGAASATR
jgi:hypothetical protein